MKFKKLVGAERSRHVGGLLPFIVCAARSHNSVAGEDSDELLALQLVRVSDDAYELTTMSAGGTPDG